MSNNRNSRDDVMHIPIFWDLDMTLTEEYQQEPLFREYETELKAAYSNRGLPFEVPHDYFRRPNDLSDLVGLTYMTTMIWDAQQGGPLEGLSREALFEHGKEVRAAQGLREGFESLKNMFDGHAQLHHMIVSVGLLPMIKGFIAEQGIEDMVDYIAASDFTTDEHGTINGIREIVIPFNKTEWVISLIKGNRALLDREMTHGQYKFNYRNMLVVGDGKTDISMWSFGKKNGGTPICVYRAGCETDYAKAMAEVYGRVDYLLPRDYTPGGACISMLAEAIERKISRKCNWRPNSLYDFRKGSVKHPDEVKAIEKHLGKCDECHQFYDKVLVTPFGSVERQHSDIALI